MIGVRVPAVAPASVSAWHGSRHDRCPCGGIVTLSIECVYGRTLEICDGPCGYRGAPRIDPAVAAELEASRARRDEQNNRKCARCRKAIRGARTKCWRCYAAEKVETGKVRPKKRVA